MRPQGGSPLFFASFAFYLTFWSVCRAVQINRTIDDYLGDSITGLKPIYLPSTGAWADQNCSVCAIQPDPKLAFDGTWTAMTYDPKINNVSLTLQFTGVAIWVFFILANANARAITTTTQCNFTLDGRSAGNFTHIPNENSSAMQYNATAFSVSGLSNTSHQLIVSTNDFPVDVFLNFDYAIYTVDINDTTPTTSNQASNTKSTYTSSQSTNSAYTSSSSRSHPSSIGIIVGCTLGGVALVVVVTVLFLIRRLPRKVYSKSTQAPTLDFNNPQVEDYHRNTAASHVPWQTTIHSISSERVGTTATVSPVPYVPSHAPSSSPMTSSSVARDVQPLLSHNAGTQDRTRAMRQMEINERLQSAQQEMNRLTRAQSIRTTGNGPTSAEVGQEVASLRTQMQSLRSQIEDLHRQRQSDWAMGLSDEGPPAYS